VPAKYGVVSGDWTIADVLDRENISLFAVFSRDYRGVMDWVVTH
jgi:hypothetical protein